MRRAWLSASLVLLACNRQPSTSDTRAQQAPAGKPEAGSNGPGSIGPAPNDSKRFEIGPGPEPEPLSAAVIDAEVDVQPYELDFWLEGDSACNGGKLSGSAPPHGNAIRCVDAEGRWTGLEARFHENGKLQSIGRRQQSRMIGVWLDFHPSGATAAEYNYVDGQLHGTLRRWAENKQEIEYGEYRGGRPWGLLIQRDEQGQELSRSQLDKGTGVLVSVSPSRRTESDYVHGLLHGSHRAFDAQGHKLEESHWSAGELHGLQTRWDAEGHKLFEGQWKLGELHGEHTRFDGGQLVERSIWLEGKQVARQLFRDGAPLGPLPAPTDCDTDAGLSNYLARARGEGLPDEHACVTREPMFPGVIMLGRFAYDRGCMGADFVVDCKLASPAPSAAELLARAGWARATGEQRIEIAKAYLAELALGNAGSITSEPDEPQWQVLPDGGVEAIVWVAGPVGMRRGVDKDKLRFTFAADGSLKREPLEHLSAQED